MKKELQNKNVSMRIGAIKPKPNKRTKIIEFAVKKAVNEYKDAYKRLALE